MTAYFVLRNTNIFESKKGFEPNSWDYKSIFNPDFDVYYLNKKSKRQSVFGSKAICSESWIVFPNQ